MKQRITLVNKGLFKKRILSEKQLLTTMLLSELRLFKQRMISELQMLKQKLLGLRLNRTLQILVSCRILMPRRR
jgi:hypothetical protein